MENHCPVCGLTGLEAFEEDGSPTFAICICCGNEAGNEYGISTSEARMEELRREWLYAKKAEWWKPREKPEGWDALAQLRGAGIPAPE
jgi:uncharacterized protein YfiM (DUF2279 family)